MDFSHPRPNGVQAGRASFIQHPSKLQFPLKEGKIRSREFVMEFQINYLARISPPARRACPDSSGSGFAVWRRRGGSRLHFDLNLNIHY